MTIDEIMEMPFLDADLTARVKAAREEGTVMDRHKVGTEVAQRAVQIIARDGHASALSLSLGIPCELRTAGRIVAMLKHTGRYVKQGYGIVSKDPATNIRPHSATSGHKDPATPKESTTCEDSATSEHPATEIRPQAERNARLVSAVARKIAEDVASIEREMAEEAAVAVDAWTGLPRARQEPVSPAPAEEAPTEPVMGYSDPEWDAALREANERQAAALARPAAYMTQDDFAKAAAEEEPYVCEDMPAMHAREAQERQAPALAKLNHDMAQAAAQQAAENAEMAE